RPHAGRRQGAPLGRPAEPVGARGGPARAPQPWLSMTTEQPPSDAPTTDPSGPPTSEDAPPTPAPAGEGSGTLLSAPQPATRWEVDFEERLSRSERAVQRVEE